MKKEIISKFKEKPKTKIAWWAMGFGISFAVCPVSLIAIMLITDKRINVLPFLFPLFVLALATGITAYRKGERSYILWIGLIPTIIISVLMVLILIAEFTFME